MIGWSGNRWARARAWLTVAGGGLWVVVAAAYPVAQGLFEAAVLAPPALACGLLEVHHRHGHRLGTAGVAGRNLVAVGLATGFLALLANALFQPGIALLLIVGLPASSALVCLGLGSPLLAATVWRGGLVTAPTAVAMGSLLPLALVVGAQVPPVGPAVLGAYGLPWMALGLRLDRRRTAPHYFREFSAPGVDLQVIVACAGATALAVVGVAGLTGAGILDVVPFTGGRPILDWLHLLAGSGGLAVVALARGTARHWNALVGATFLVLAAVEVASFFLPAGGSPVAWLVPFFHTWIGIVSLAVGVAGWQEASAPGSRPTTDAGYA